MNRGKPRGTCKDCHNAYVRDRWYRGEGNKEKQLEYNRKWKEKNKARNIANRWGLDTDEVAEILLIDRCELCGSSERLVVDHDHQTMKVRGRLCNTCNVSIGKLGDTIESITEVLKYLHKRK